MQENSVDANVVIDILVRKIALLEKSAAIIEAELFELRNRTTKVSNPVVAEMPSVQ